MASAKKAAVKKAVAKKLPLDQQQPTRAQKRTAAPPLRPQPVTPGAVAGPSAMVIFGAGGDLTHRLLLPALYNLVRARLLPDDFALIGASAGKRTPKSWSEDLHGALEKFVGGKKGEAAQGKIDDAAWAWIAKRIHYIDLDFGNAADYKRLGKLLEQTVKTYHTGGNVLFYLATADQFFAPIVEQLACARLADKSYGDPNTRTPKPWRRVIVEKPFGSDLASAQALNAKLLKTLREDQIFRIDHFLGKETVQNILAFRFANGLFEPIWHRDRIDHVQITAGETVGVEARASFYEKTGCLKDMVPNHLFQLLAMVAMEPPTSFGADAIRSRKADVLSAIRPVRIEDAVRGQYGSGMVLDAAAKAYRDEPGVAPDSSTDTYAALKINIDSWRWAGVPFYLRTGKHLSRRTTEIAIRFKSAPFAPFRNTEIGSFGPDWLVLHIQPDEGISLQFDVKRPGQKVQLAPVRMEFRYKDWFEPTTTVGYETLIYDCMVGDQTLFQRADMVEAGWRAVQPIIDYWRNNKPQDFPNYASGSAGPSAADVLLARDGGRSWRPLAAPPVPNGLNPG